MFRYSPVQRVGLQSGHDHRATPMTSNHSNLIVLIRIAGNVLACFPNGSAPVRIRRVGISTGTPPQQPQAIALLRSERER